MTRNILPLLVLCIVESSGAMAQDTSFNNNNCKFKIGAKFIADRSTMNELEKDGHRAYSGGLQFVTRIKKSDFNIESGVYYYTQSGYYSFVHDLIGVNQNNFRVPFNYNSILIPVNLRYDTRLVYFAAGFYGSYLTNRISGEKGFSQYNDTLSELNKRYNFSDRKINFGYNLTVGLEKEFGKNYNLFVEGHYSRSLTTIWDTKYAGKNPLFINLGFSIGVNYKFI